MSKQRNESNYQRYLREEWTTPEYYLPAQAVDATLYRPVATWMGRLILNAGEARDAEGGCGLEILHADVAHADWVGRRIRLRYCKNPSTQRRNEAVTLDVTFNAAAQKLANDGAILAERINGWRMVTPLESLAASHPYDDIIVRLVEPVVIDEAPSDGGAPLLIIEQEPVQISGLYAGLVTFLAPFNTRGDRWRVRHYNTTSLAFDGAEEIVAVPAPAADENNTFPSTSVGIDRSPLNQEGWYIYGAAGKEGLFVVQAWTPRALLRLEPQRVQMGKEAAWRSIRHDAWSHLIARKGTIASILCDPSAANEATARAGWKVGDRALLLHVYGGIGGKQREPKARTGFYFGHFAFGIANVIDEPLAGEPRFDITFYQIYTQNVDGVVAGVLDWSRFMGDRQFGWGGLRPTCNILIKFDEFNECLFKERAVIGDRPTSSLDLVRDNLEQMAARYRIGDGRGATYVTAANNCAQDSSQALYNAMVEIRACGERVIPPEAGMAANPTHAARVRDLQMLARALQHKVAGGVGRRADWRYRVENLGINENPLRNLLRGLESWRSALPRKLSDTYAETFLAQGAALWVLSTYQVGGFNPDIEPIAPLTF